MDHADTVIFACSSLRDYIGAALDHVEGSDLLLEKLVMGRWDDQFLVAEPGHLIRHADFFE